MPHSKVEQPKGNQPSLPTDQLSAAVSKYFNNGEYSQMQKALEVGSYFLSGCMAVNISQLLAAPLYLVNQDWYNAWIALTKQSIGLLTTTLTQYWAPTVVRVSGDKSVRGQLTKTTNGTLLCTFPQRLVLIANHQIYTDWLYMWWIAYCNGMHGHIFIVLKESLRHIPILGWGMRLSQFIFLKRNWEEDKPQMAKHFSHLNNMSLPMWLLIFPEGTNLAESTRERSAQWAKKNSIQDLQHTLIPRSTGLRFCLQQMRETVRYVYDCTIAYEGVPRGQYAQDIFTVKSAYLEGQPPRSVNMYWRRFALSSIPIDDPVAFEVWLRARWMEKDGLIEAYYRHGRFPADRGAHKTRDGKIVRGAGHIETEIKSNYWYEFLQIFAPVGLLALVLYMFYNALPIANATAPNKQNVTQKAKELQKTETSLQKQQLPTHAASKAPADQDSMLTKAMAMYALLSKNPSVQKVVQLPELTPNGLRKELMKHEPAIDTILTQKNALQDLKTKFPTPRASPPSQNLHRNNNPSKGAPAKVPRQPASQNKAAKAVQERAGLPRPSSQIPTPAKPAAAKLSPAKATRSKQIADQPGAQKPPVKIASTQTSSAPQLQSRGKPSTLKAVSTAKSATR